LLEELTRENLNSNNSKNRPTIKFSIKKGIRLTIETRNGSKIRAKAGFNNQKQAGKNRLKEEAKQKLEESGRI